MRTAESRKRKPKYAVLHSELREDIMSGVYPVGSKVPSVRELSRKFRVSSATAFRSLQEVIPAMCALYEPELSIDNIYKWTMLQSWTIKRAIYRQ